MCCGCSICRGPMVLCQNNETHDTVSATGCGHTFHSLCLQGWLAISMTCPKCRLAIEDSSNIKKLYFDDFTSDQCDRAIIKAKLDSLKMQIIERNAEIDNLKKSIAKSNHECELAKFQQTLMKAKLNNMNFEIRETYSRFNKVAGDAFKEASIWRKAAFSRGWQMGAMVDNAWENGNAKLAEKIIEWERVAPKIIPKVTDKYNIPWDMTNSMMIHTIHHLKIRLHEMEDSRMWLLGTMAKEEANLKTITDLHLAQMDYAKQSQQMTQREIADFKAEIKSELKTWDTRNAKTSTMMSSENAANFPTLLQSEREQHKTEPNAADNCHQNNGSEAAMKLATDQLMKEISVREVVCTIAQQEVAMSKTALHVEKETHHTQLDTIHQTDLASEHISGQEM